MCPGRQVNRCGGSPCTAVTATCTAQAAVGFDSQRRAALSLTPQSRPTQNSRYLQDVPPSCSGRRVAVWSGACPIRPPTVGKRHAHKQPANLAVEGAEESLSILPDYKPTVRPTPKRC